MNRGLIGRKYAEFKSKFVIPTDKLSAVFEVAILECKKRTANYIPLPQGEDFKVIHISFLIGKEICNGEQIIDIFM